MRPHTGPDRNANPKRAICGALVCCADTENQIQEFVRWQHSCSALHFSHEEVQCVAASIRYSFSVLQRRCRSWTGGTFHNSLRSGPTHTRLEVGGTPGAELTFPCRWPLKACVTLDLFRNERNIVARRPKTAQVAVKRAWHEAEHANVHQRDVPTWISSFPRVAKLIPESSKQRENIIDPRPRNVAFVA